MAKFQKCLEKKHAYLFIEHWQEGKRPFNWVAEWQHLTVELSDVSFAMSENVASRAFGEDEGSWLTLWDEPEAAATNQISDDVKALYTKIR